MSCAGIAPATECCRCKKPAPARNLDLCTVKPERVWYIGTMKFLHRLVGTGFPLLLLLGAPAPALAEKLYRWVDDHGHVHYGDRIPPEFAKKDRDVLNNQAIKIGSIEGEKTPEELLAMARREERRQALLKRARRDRILLATYLSVGEIELLRDRRVGLLSAQANVTSQYLDTLREKMVVLQTESTQYKPYSADENAPSIPENLAKEMLITLNTINEYERSLSKIRSNQTELEMQFAEDISRFKELKSLN